LNTTPELGIADIRDVSSFNKVASSWFSAATGYQGPSPQKPTDNGTADVDMHKRKVEWTLKNFKGGTNRVLEMSLSYEKDVLIDEL
jgi:hypothetical protein